MSSKPQAMPNSKAVNISTVNEKKNSYFRTKALTDKQFNDLKVNEKKLLMIEWHREDSIMLITGGKRVEENGYLPPPPSIYAISPNYKKSFSSISAWWRLARKDQKEAIENYDALPLCEKLRFVNNLMELMIAQDELFNNLTGKTSHHINKRRVSNDTNGHAVTVVDEQAAANTTASPAPVHRRSRVRYNNNPPALIEITNVNQSEEVEVVLNQNDEHDELSPCHSQGLFVSGSDHHHDLNDNNHNSITPTSLGSKKATHIAGTEVMKKSSHQ